MDVAATAQASCEVPATAGIADLTSLIAQSVEPLPPGVDEPIFSDLGSYAVDINVQGAGAERAQEYFDQGLRLWYAFNMPESLQSFAQAARCDPGAPMPYWGIALAAGPDVNDPTVPCPSLKLCYISAQIAVHKAKARAGSAGIPSDDIQKFSEALRAQDSQGALAIRDKYRQNASAMRALLELSCSEAIARRYTCEPTPCAKCGLDAKYRVETDQTLAFSEAMALNHQLFPETSDIATLAAFSLMQIHPWKWWDLDKTPTPEIEGAIALLEGVLAADPNHPGANHLYIHSVEEGPLPIVEKALPSARRMPKLIPASGHFQHMASHVYLNLGSYDLATQANIQAVKADREYVRKVSEFHPVARYPLHYLGHNLHFLAVTQSAQGQQAEALATAVELVGVVAEYSRGFNVQHNKDQVSNEAARFLCVPLTVSMQFDFADWRKMEELVIATRDEVSKALVAEKAKNPELPLVDAILTFGKARHALIDGDWEKAKRHAQEFSRYSQPVDASMQANPVTSIYRIADYVLVARAADAAQKDPAGAAQLPEFLKILAVPLPSEASPREMALRAWQAAIQLQDSLYYNDPPEWYYPIRQSLGAEYFRQGHYLQAERTFAEDLELNPDSPRSLFGLMESRRAQKKTIEPDLEKKFQSLWGANPLPSMKTM